MTSMYWQSALLLGLAYFLGCCLACMLRRMMSDAPETRAGWTRLVAHRKAD